ncbi:MAG: glutamine--fructose-6-phosphate transaminase (isomerizing) [archaeon GB-1867-005]|nr:glutamine--fructose-6-phosphate transaminase (isomerizing) [Candidatus Culexmicrobium cathedralense]
MCGIIGISALPSYFKEPIGKVIEKCLKRLEYRGYDSVGFAYIDFINSRIVVRKAKGKLDEVSSKLDFESADSNVAIGHTRWATHGKPSDYNAHPHIDCKGEIAVVHNGIIQNYLELKEDLISRGHSFRSETDTEVIPHILEEYLHRGYSPIEAIKEAFRILRGAFAFAAIFAVEPNRIFFAKMTSPLVIGIGSKAKFLASDIPAFLEFTNRVIVVRDGEFGYISPNKIYLEDLNQGEVNVRFRVRVISWTPEMAMKGGYPHFMLKEIHEQPIAIRRTLQGLSAAEVAEAADLILKAKRVFITACGTSFHAGLVADYALTRIAGIPVHAFIASEFLKYENVFSEDDVGIVISQSGETIDSLIALRKMKKAGMKVIAVSNVIDSAIPRESDIAIYTRAGPEIGVAATKTFTTQIITLLKVACEAAKRINVDVEVIEDEIAKTPRYASYIIRAHEAKCKEIGVTLSSANSAFYLSRGVGVPLSMEGALKLKEIAYIHAEAYPAGESKHGPIALVEPDFPVIFSVLLDNYRKSLAGNIAEMKARGALTIGLTPIGEEQFGKLLDKSIEMPRLHPLVAPVIYVIPMQLLAYYAAVTKGYDPDKPRNLAKTVTVE